MRRWVRAPKPSQIGIWRRNRHRTLRSISASMGDWLRRDSDSLRVRLRVWLAESRLAASDPQLGSCASSDSGKPQ